MNHHSGGKWLNHNIKDYKDSLLQVENIPGRWMKAEMV